MKKTIIALSLIAASTTALADGSAFYVGGSIGQSNTKFKTEDFTLNHPEFSERQQHHATAWKVFAGYNFNQYLAIEGGYTDFGKVNYKYTGTGSWAGRHIDVLLDQYSWFVAGKGTFPINEQFNVFGKIGATSNHVKTWLNTNIPDLSDSGTERKTRTDALLGLGAEYMPTKNIGIRLEYENYGRFGDQEHTRRTQVDLWSVGVVFKF